MSITDSYSLDNHLLQHDNMEDIYVYGYKIHFISMKDVTLSKKKTKNKNCHILILFKKCFCYIKKKPKVVDGQLQRYMYLMIYKWMPIC